MSTKNHSGDKRGGFVSISDVAGTLPGVVPRGRAMSAQTRHHFTTLRQVNQLIEASEADADMGFVRGCSPSARCRARTQKPGFSTSGAMGRTRST